jgi:hypothetical protein
MLGDHAACVVSDDKHEIVFRKWSLLVPTTSALNLMGCVSLTV